MRVLLFVCASLFIGLGSAKAQLSPATQEALKLVTPDAIAMVTIQPKLVLEDESARYLPWELISAAGLEYFSIDPTQLLRVDAVIGMPGPAGIQAGALLTLGEDLSPDFLEMLDKVDASSPKAIELYRHSDFPGVVLHVKSPRQVLIGTPVWVTRAVRSQGVDGPLRSMVAGLGEPTELSMVLALKPLRDLLVSAADAPQLEQIPGLATDAKLLAEKGDMVALRLMLKPQAVTAYLIQTESPADATVVNDALGRLTKLGSQMLIQGLEPEAARAEGETPKAVLAYLHRFAPEFQKQMKFTVNGNRLLLKQTGTQMMTSQVGVMVGLLLPAVQAARQAARRMQSQNNMKQIMLALHNYESVYKRIPSDADYPVKDPQNPTAHLSWRVKILPFIEQVELYNEFHHDEPWDSPHNIKLLAKMPSTYAHPNAITRPGYTVYQMPKGERFLSWPMRFLRFSQITDGTSNTIALVETTDQTAKPWTKPDDVNPLDNIAILREQAGQTQVAMLDGSVRVISAARSLDDWRALFTIDGGEVVNLDR